MGHPLELMGHLSLAAELAPFFFGPLRDPVIRFVSASCPMRITNETDDKLSTHKTALQAFHKNRDASPKRINAMQLLRSSMVAQEVNSINSPK